MVQKETADIDTAVDPRDVADLLARLLDKSLVHFEEGPDGGRFRLPELVREYGREVMMERGEGVSLRRRHREYFTGLALAAERGLSSPDQPEWMRRLEDEHDNLRAALDDAVNALDDSGASAARIATAIWRFWYFHGYLGEGRRRLERVLEQPDLVPALRAKALNAAGAIAREAGDYEASKAFHEESITLFRTLGDERGLAAALGNCGNLALNQRDFGAAEALYRGSLALCRKMGDRIRTAYNLNNLGVVARHHGDTKTAWALYEEALAIHRDLGNRQWEGITLSNLGSLAHYEANYEQARSFQLESLQIRREVGDKSGMAVSLDAFGALAIVGEPATDADFQRAARLFGAAQGIRRSIGAALHGEEEEEWERDINQVRAHLGGAAFEREWNRGMSMPPEKAIEEALEASE